MPCGLEELIQEWRYKRDGKDCCWNVIVTAVEARGLKGIGNHGLNDCQLKVSMSTDPDVPLESKTHTKTSTPFFNQPFKLSFTGQPATFFSSIVQIEVMHVRGWPFPAKLIGLVRIGILDVFLMKDHKLPLQWFPIVDPSSEEPSVPRGYLRMNIIVNSLDETGAVQSDVPLEERSQAELLVIPRMHPCATSTGVYNILFKIYRACDLKMMDSWGVDSYVRIVCSCGENRTDSRSGTLNPVWNQQLQLPVYEPLFRELITVEVCQDGSDEVMSRLFFTWKDIISNQEFYSQVQWYDMYELPKDLIGRIANNSIVRTMARHMNLPKFSTGGVFQDASDYCGRILFSVSIENREGDSKPPSLAQTEMKPKDCKFFEDVPQKAFFRFQIFFAQGLPVLPISWVQVELMIGNKSVSSKAVQPNTLNLCEWYQSVELEMDFLYDDMKWPWSCSGQNNDYDQGLVPTEFIDEGMPDVWIRVYQCNMLALAVSSVNERTRTLIGFKRCSIRDFLKLRRDSNKPKSKLESVHGSHYNEDDEIDRRNLILNKRGSSQPAFFLKDAEKLPDWFNPDTIKHDPYLKYTLKAPGWPAPRTDMESTNASEYPQFDDGRENKNSMDPYIGVQCLRLEKDGTCKLGDDEFPGRIWLSCKCYLPSRDNCRGAVKGPPILSPFTKYNTVALPRPEQMADCKQVFSLRVHVYQARDLQGTDKVGLANAHVEVNFMGRNAETHVVHGSNSPTWDSTLQGGKLDFIEISCLGWPGRNYDCNSDVENTKYNVNADPGEVYQEDVWKSNQAMFFFVPWIEVKVMDQKELLGRCFIDPKTCRHTIQDPEWYEIFKGNPEQDEGKILLSAQLIHKSDPLNNIIVSEIIPIRTEKPQDGKDFSWDRDQVGLHIPAEISKTKPVFMRDCRIQVQLLGIRDLSRKLTLTSPAIAIFVQTTDRWDADQGFSYVCTPPKEGIGDLHNQNYLETLELKLQLPDDVDYTPALEFALIDETGFWDLGFTRLGYTTREILAWGSVSLREFHPQGTEKVEEQQEEEDDDPAAMKRHEEKELQKKFRTILEDLEGRQTISLQDSKELRKGYDREEESAVKKAAKICTESPSEGAFVERTEEHLTKDEAKAAKNKVRKQETISEEADMPKDDQEQDGTLNPAESASPNNQKLKDDGNPKDLPSANKHDDFVSKGGNGVNQDALGAQYPPIDGNLLYIAVNPAIEIEPADAGPQTDDGAPNPQERAPIVDTQLGQANTIAEFTEEHSGEADKIDIDDEDEGGANRIAPDDDQDADRQEEIDTPDGKPNSEWLIFRRNKLYTQPLEETEDEGWRQKLQDSFTEISLFRGKIEDYKRKESYRLGIIKCKVKIFRKEDANDRGLSKRSDYKKEACFYETLPSDPSVQLGLDIVRPYRMENIREKFEDCVVDVRLYCLKAVQVTPGGLNRQKDGAPYWYHYLECRLGSIRKDSDGDNKLNPNFFHLFEIKGVPLPGASQLTVALRDGYYDNHTVKDSELVGETTIDLEDRWFCPEWRDLLHKPREVRDLVNDKQPGISQGKLLIVLDILEETKAEDNPPMDIKVMGKTLPMEMRVIIWDTKDTAAKDGYTSDVYVSCEMLELGEPKMTDTHIGVKRGALGMFNWRLKWRCKYPLDGVEYLFRIGIWDENMLTPHQNIAEGVLPLRPLFQECFEKNQGKTSPDEMEVVSLPPTDDAAGKGGYHVAEDGTRYPFRWYTLLHPSFGFNPDKDAQAKLKITIQVLPRAKARANPAGNKRNGPALLGEPDRPPQPANPILESEKCKAYIVYSIKECFARCRTPCICCCCVLIVVAIVAAVVGVKMALA